MFVDATYCKARVNHRVALQAIVVTIGATADGLREVPGMDVGDSDDMAFWTAFCRRLTARGLGGVQLVISDAHVGLKQAVAPFRIGPSLQQSSVNMCMGGVFPLLRLRHRESTLAAWPSRSSSRPVPAGGGRP